jgi:hypothetical protein
LYRFRFIGLFVLAASGCTYYADVSRHKGCDQCEGDGRADAGDLDQSDAAVDADAADAVSGDISNCANGRDC